MRELFIIRHAIAYERDAAKWPNDDERPLTEDGIRKFRQAARGLKRLVDPPEELLTSPLPRARQTAAILEEHAGFPAAVELDILRPDAELSAQIRALQARGPARVAVVGHEPDLSQLIGALAGSQGARVAVEMKKGAVAHLAFERRIKAGAGQLLALLPPRVLRALQRKS
jgi:phosphohistidine phosphatase